MDFNKLTLKSQEAVAGAQDLARKRANPEVVPEHLLLALLEQELPKTTKGCEFLVAVSQHDESAHLRPGRRSQRLAERHEMRAPDGRVGTDRRFAQERVRKARIEVRGCGERADQRVNAGVVADGQGQIIGAYEKVRPYVDQHYWLPLYSMGAFATLRERELGYRPTAGNQGRLEALREPLPCW